MNGTLPKWLRYQMSVICEYMAYLFAFVYILSITYDFVIYEVNIRPFCNQISKGESIQEVRAKIKDSGLYFHEFPERQQRKRKEHAAIIVQTQAPFSCFACIIEHADHKVVSSYSHVYCEPGG